MPHTEDLEAWPEDNEEHPRYADLAKSESPTVRHASVAPRTVPDSPDLSEERADPTTPIALAELDVSRERTEDPLPSIGPKDPTQVSRLPRTSSNRSTDHTGRWIILGTVVLLLSIGLGFGASRWWAAPTPAPSTKPVDQETNVLRSETVLETAPPEPVDQETNVLRSKTVLETTPPPAVKSSAPPPPAPPPKDERVLACENKNRKACFALGRSYLSRNATDIDKAIQYLSRACQLKSPIGCLEAAKQLETRGQGRDRKKARRFYERACDAGRGSACAELARMWHKGIGGASNPRTADAFEHRACQLGYSAACRP